MYSPVAAPPNHHSTTSEKPTPIEIQAADSIAASFVLTACASRWITRRSTSSSATISASRTSHCHGWTVSSTKLPPPLFGGEQWEHRWCDFLHLVSLVPAPTIACAAASRAIGHPVRRAAHVVEPGFVEQGDALGIAAVLAAHPNLELGLGGPTPRGADLDQFADSGLVDGLERVALQQPLFEVGRHHPALDVVAAEAERHLREVVGAEAEEVRLLGDLVGPERGSWRLDHRADRDLRLLLHPLGGVGDLVLHPAPRERELLAGHGQRDHDLDDRVLPLRPQLGGGGQERPHLHRVQPRLDHAEAHPARAEHRVVLGPALGRGEQPLLLGGEPFARLLDAQLLDRREELVQRRVEQADRHRQPVHRLEDLGEVVLLDLAQLVERLGLLLRGGGEDHPPDHRQPIRGEEHVLGAAQPDALGAEAAGVVGVLAGVGVGAHAELALAHRVGPFQDRRELGGRFGRGELHRPEHDLARRAVDGDDVAFGDGLAVRS